VRLDVSGLGRPLPADRAEAIGCGAYWTAETQHDPFLPLALAARETSHIGLGTGIATAFTRSPMITAVLAWDLQAASSGRFMLGLGTQVRAHNARRFSVDAERPAARLRELVLALRHVWEAFQGEHPMEFRGEFYRLDLLPPFFNPGPIEHPRVPIYLAAVTPRLYKLAGEVADGVHVHPFHTASYLREVAVPAMGKKLPLVTGVICVVGGAEAREAARQQIGFYASTPLYRPVVEHHGLGEVQTELGKLAAAGRFDELGSVVPDELLREVAVEADTWEDAAHIIRERYEGLVDAVWIYPTPSLPSDDELRRVAAALG
jgi:probable F420-dependent oxidoreductase